MVIREVAPIAALAVRNDENEVIGTDLPQAMRAAGPGQDGCPGTNHRSLPVQGEFARAAQDVIDLVDILMVVPDRGATV